MMKVKQNLWFVHRVWERGRVVMREYELHETSERHNNDYGTEFDLNEELAWQFGRAEYVPFPLPEVGEVCRRYLAKGSDFSGWDTLRLRDRIIRDYVVRWESIREASVWCARPGWEELLKATQKLAEEAVSYWGEWRLWKHGGRKP